MLLVYIKPYKGLKSERQDSTRLVEMAVSLSPHCEESGGSFFNFNCIDVPFQLWNGVSCCGAWDRDRVPRAVKIRRTFSESVVRMVSEEIAFYAHAVLKSTFVSERETCSDGFSFCCSQRFCSWFELIKMEELECFTDMFLLVCTVTAIGYSQHKIPSVVLLHLSLGQSCSLVLFERVAGKRSCFCMVLSSWWGCRGQRAIDEMGRIDRTETFKRWVGWAGNVNNFGIEMK